MTAIFPGWAVLCQRTVNGRVMVMLWKLVSEGAEICLALHSGKGAKGGWFYRSRWAAEKALEEWDGVTAPAAGEWRDFA